MLPLRPRLIWTFTVFIVFSVCLRHVLVRFTEAPDSRPPPGTHLARFASTAPNPAAEPARAPPRPEPSPLQKDSIAAALLAEPHDLSDPAAREKLVRALQAAADAELLAVQRKAEANGLPLVAANGAVLVGFDGERPLYDANHNEYAAITTATDQVREIQPFTPTGDGLVIGMWEAGQIPRTTHEQLVGRITVGDNESNIGTHATHVAGTLAAAGTSGREYLRGMAPEAQLIAFNSSSEIAEMTNYAAAFPNEAGKIYISNHAYGVVSGWTQPPMVWYGDFSDDGNPENDYAPAFGRYGASSAAWDGLVRSAPYYLPFKSAGNDRNDFNPFSGAEWQLNSSQSQVYYYDPAIHPKADYAHRTSNGKNGYDTITLRGVAKNVITVGSVGDAVDSGTRNAALVELSDFSSAGPSDDGRIKPDIVANGESVNSLGADSDSDEASLNGSSMATANASGSALLLQQLYRGLFPGDALRGSSLKALILGTADDLGNPGPDYQYGWGLMNLKTAADLILDHASSPYLRRILEGGLNNGSSDQFDFIWEGSGSIQITLSWMDPPGPSTNAHDSRAPRLVHDLNLKLTAPDGTTHYLPYTMPWVGDWTDAKLDAHAVPGINTVDTVEQIYLESPTQSGTYTITVDSSGSISGNQSYSLVLRGGAVPTSGYGAWVVQHYPTEWNDPALTGFTRDSDGNGIPNGMEYACNLPPGTSISPDPQLYSVGKETEEGIDYFTLTYQRNTTKNDLNYTAQWSTNLIEWFPLSSTLESTSGPIETRQARIPIEDDKKFIRLYVSLEQLE